MMDRVGDAFECKLTDFGFASIIGDGCSNSTAEIGTNLYKAPEIFARQAKDVKIDIWALGVLTY